MSSLSLEASIRTCKVDTGWASRIQTDRMFNPDLMVCPVWNGMDSAGRHVCPDSFYTKRAGCNSAEDRVLVENDQRPQYMEYVNLSAQGFDSDIYADTMPWQNLANSNADMKEVERSPGYGNFGLQMDSKTLAPCAYSQYAQAMSQEAAVARKMQGMQQGYLSNQAKCASGF
jgi:hypothetical protein